MIPYLPRHPSVQDYALIRLNCKKIFEEELKQFKKTDQNEYCKLTQSLVWHNKQNQFHRTDGPAIITKNGECRWFENGKNHRKHGPSSICQEKKFLSWRHHGKIHRIGGFANFDARADLYTLIVEDKNYTNVDDYIKACQEYLIKIYSAHECLEKFEKLNEIRDLGYLDAKNWENGLFIA